MDDPLVLVVGIGLVAIGAVGATLTQRRFDLEGRSRLGLLAIVPFGVLLGAGAAIARGWDLPLAMVSGGLVVPLVGALGRTLEVRRARRRDAAGR